MGRTNRNMIEGLSAEFKEFRIDIKQEFKELRETNKILYNHLSDRLPKWAVVIGGLGVTLFGLVIGALINTLLQ